MLNDLKNPYISYIIRRLSSIGLRSWADDRPAIQCWSDQSDAILQDCFDHVDWDMFRAVSDDDIEAYSDSVTCFIRKCVEDVVPTKTIHVYPNSTIQHQQRKKHVAGHQ